MRPIDFEPTCRRPCFRVSFRIRLEAIWSSCGLNPFPSAVPSGDAEPGFEVMTTVEVCQQGDEMAFQLP